MNKAASIIITAGLVVGLGVLFLGGPDNTSDVTDSQPAQSVEIRDEVQYVTINARGGYSPRVSKAQAGIPTKLIVKTNNTYDCSAALVIRSIGYQKILPSTGEEIIDLGTPKPGTIQGLCSMGMYGFTIDFS